MLLPPFTFGPSGQILFGRGRGQEAAGLVAGMARRVVLVHGRDPARAAWLVEGLRAEGVTVSAVACPGEPTLPLLEEALASARAARPDAVVAIGGGAAIDLGKALAALIPQESAPLDHLEVVGRGLPLARDPLPCIALPTTAGTGAEVTKNAVVGVPEHRRKVSLRDPRMVPRLAIVDPALTDGLPRAVTLASGLDALTQVIEPYLSARANPFTDALCRAAIPLALPALATLMAREDADARDAMAFVSLSGGLALAHAGLGVVHGLAGPIGGLSDAPHGAVCGALLPHALDALAARAEPGSPLAARVAEVRAIVGAALGVAPDDAQAALAAFARASGLPGLVALGVARDDFATLADMAATSSSMKASAIAFTPAELVALLDAAA
ncbi:iron-containing alcohol dehydrogenase [Salinarimonas ramus]|uniref:Alcohol dehydrogenase n=1 Tax=Salinarimonas ramus TaxID=690164 RepID=A0A917V3F1_9HYPH|nr:iron-containing alcohol dehydrogenase [Salinarimonas ramus]GGK31635.1 alcohol dehydrogenase [Salinarimonas ramus]